MTRTLICLAVLSAATLLRTAPATAAESYDNCTGFITSVPATITTQGVWCMDRDLSTAITSGNAITVATNNVIIDCNHFKLGGLQAGTDTNAVGVVAQLRMNATIRNCNIRGFRAGVLFDGGGGHVVERNRFDGNTGNGIVVFAAGSIVRDNQVNDSGGSTSQLFSFPAIYVQEGVDVIGNFVGGVAPNGVNLAAYGIYALGNSDGSVSGNRVRGLAPSGTGTAYGIYATSSAGMAVRDNIVLGPGGGTGIFCPDNQVTAQGNTVAKFAVGIFNCFAEGNAVNPN